MTKLGPPPEDIDGLRHENQVLRAELQKRIKSEKRAVELKIRALNTSGSLLFSLFDRKKILTNFTNLFETLSRFSGPREQWPSRDDILADSKALSLSWIRFAIRRRTLMFLLALAAFVIPGIQIYLVMQQNEIIKNQNKFFEIEVYDIVARSMTSGEMSAKQMTGALLARSDLGFLDGIVTEVFGAGSDMGASLVSTDADTLARRLRDAAFRGHIILGLARAIEVHRADESAMALHKQVYPMFTKVMDDAAPRVTELLKVGRDEVLEDTQTAEEVYRYLANLGTLLRKEWSLALAVDEQAQFFVAVTPLIKRVSEYRASGFAEKSPLATVFFDEAMHQFLIDLALRPQFGEPPPEITGNIEDLTARGFAELQKGIGEGRDIKWSNLKRLAGIQ